MEIQITAVKKCSAKNCAFNEDRKCMAKNIKVGDTVPVCDTYKESGKKQGIANGVASVASCGVKTCVFNRKGKCGAYMVEIKKKNGRAYCAAYEEP